VHPAAAAGIEGGDLVTTLNAAAVTSVAQACDILGRVGAGGDVEVQGLHLAHPAAATDPLGQAWTSKLTIK